MAAKSVWLAIVGIAAAITLANLDSPRAVAQSGAANRDVASADVDPVLRLEEVTDTNHVARLIKDGAKSVVVAYSSLEASAAQTEILTMVLRESHVYRGAVNFYRLDQAKHPVAWSDIKDGAAWTTGPVFMLVNNSPLVIGTINENNDTPVHNLSSTRLRAEIARLFKVRLPAVHANVSDIDDKVTAIGLPTFIMAYRSKGPKYDRNQFQRFVYESQLYANRVNFVVVDLDESDVSSKLGIRFPKQDDAYFVVYNPKLKNGAMAFDPAMTPKNMEVVIRQYFSIEPARIVE